MIKLIWWYLYLRQPPFLNDPTSSPDNVSLINSESVLTPPSSSTPTTSNPFYGKFHEAMLQLIEKKRNKTDLGLRTLSEASNTDTGRRVSLTSVSSTEGIPKTEMSDSVDSTIHDPSSTIPYSTLAYENEHRKRNRFIDDATLTPDDLYKRKKLRQRNKVAATKCRIKRKARHQLLILVRYQKTCYC